MSDGIDNNCDGKQAYAVGDIGSAGGIVVYVNPSDAQSGLEAASADVNINGQNRFQWGCYGVVVSNNSNGITDNYTDGSASDAVAETLGKGAVNTQAI